MQGLPDDLAKIVLADGLPGEHCGLHTTIWSFWHASGSAPCSDFRVLPAHTHTTGECPCMPLGPTALQHCLLAVAHHTPEGCCAHLHSGAPLRKACTCLRQQPAAAHCTLGCCIQLLAQATCKPIAGLGTPQLAHRGAVVLRSRC